MIRKIFYIILFVLSICITLFGQNNGGDKINEQVSILKQKYPKPELSKEQMFQDFDSLYNVIKSCNPQLEVRKLITGIDILSELRNLRKEIDTIKKSDNFILLLYRALRLTQDEHCQIGTLLWYYQYSFYKKEAKKYDEKYFALTFSYSEIIREKVIQFLNVKYINGKYYLTEKLSIYQKNDTVAITEGAEIIAVNGLSLNEYIEKYRDIQWDLRWDFNKKIFYAQSISKHSSYKLKSISYSVNKNTVTLDLIESYKQILENNMFSQMKTVCVKYLSKDSLLYIRCPIMDESYIKFYKKEIGKVKKLPLKKVIIDVRGNTGGSDDVWFSILNLLIPKPIENNLVLLSKKNNGVEQFIRNKDKSGNIRTITPLWDKSQAYNVAFEETDKIKPKHSLNYSGKIYILQDEDVYSSASCLTTMCLYNDNLVSIGRSNDKLGGRGIEAMSFGLPNSKLIFFLDILIDNTNAKEAKDIYHSEVEMPISLPIEYYINRNKYKDNTSSEEYLYNYDLLFKKVLEIK